MEEKKETKLVEPEKQKSFQKNAYVKEVPDFKMDDNKC